MGLIYYYVDDDIYRRDCRNESRSPTFTHADEPHPLKYIKRENEIWI